MSTIPGKIAVLESNMRFLAVLLFVFTLIFATNPANADWKVLLDGTGPNPAYIISSTQRALHYFVTGGTFADSAWLFISDGFSVDVCTDDDVTTVALGANSFGAKIWIHHETKSGTTPTTRLNARVIFLKTLDGEASTNGTTDDCHYQIFGPAWIQAEITGTPTNAALISVTSRRAIKQ